MSIEILEAKAELKDLVDTFSNLADVKDAAAQGELFLPDGALEFQMGIDGDINKIEGREALVQAFAATINPCKAVYHINGQHTVTVNGDSAEGIAYCMATLVNDVDGKDQGHRDHELRPLLRPLREGGRQMVHQAPPHHFYDIRQA